MERSLTKPRISRNLGISGILKVSQFCFTSGHVTWWAKKLTTWTKSASFGGQSASLGGQSASLGGQSSPLVTFLYSNSFLGLDESFITKKAKKVVAGPKIG